MSRTFEVLERVQEDQELFRVPPTKEASHIFRNPTNGLPEPAAGAQDALLGLVQRLFLAADGAVGSRVRKVVFCGIDDTSDSSPLCASVGFSLAQQVQSQVCVVNANLRALASCPLFDLAPSDSSAQTECGTSKKLLRQVRDNLWLASSDTVIANGGAPTLEQFRVLIRDLEDEFAYFIISAPPIGLFGDAALLGQAADGVVLVLEANSTRRVTALKAKRTLEGVNARVLGTVLNNRSFPIPEEIYRRL
jgi:Mrp family chromosome partitioning ATPase